MHVNNMLNYCCDHSLFNAYLCKGINVLCNLNSVLDDTSVSYHQTTHSIKSPYLNKVLCSKILLIHLKCLILLNSEINLIISVVCNKSILEIDYF